MKKIQANIMLIQIDDNGKASLVVRDGDAVLVIPLDTGKVRNMTKQERERGDHRSKE